LVARLLTEKEWFDSSWDRKEEVGTLVKSRSNNFRWEEDRKNAIALKALRYKGAE